MEPYKREPHTCTLWNRCPSYTVQVKEAGRWTAERTRIPANVVLTNVVLKWHHRYWALEPIEAAARTGDWQGEQQRAWPTGAQC